VHVKQHDISFTIMVMVKKERKNFRIWPKCYFPKDTQGLPKHVSKGTDAT